MIIIEGKTVPTGEGVTVRPMTLDDCIEWRNDLVDVTDAEELLDILIAEVRRLHTQAEHREQNVYVAHSIPVDVWEVRSREAVLRLREAINRAEYEEAVKWAVARSDRKIVALGMIPPEGISPWKEWRHESFYRGGVNWHNGCWEAAPKDDDTVVLLRRESDVLSYMGAQLRSSDKQGAS
jgi:hypothetical protein